MFFSKYIFVTKGKLAPIWLAANWDKKLTKKEVSEISVNDSVKDIIKPQHPLALRLSGKLLMGVVKLWQRKMGYLHEDCNDALSKLKKRVQKEKKTGRSTQLAKSQSNGSKNLITINEARMKDMFSDIKAGSDFMMSVEEMQTFFEDGHHANMQADAQDLLLDEDTSASFDLSKDSSMDDGSLLLTDSLDDGGANGFSLLMDALNHDENSIQESQPVDQSVEKGQNLSVDDPPSDVSDIDMSDGEMDLAQPEDLERPGLDHLSEAGDPSLLDVNLSKVSEINMSNASAPLGSLDLGQASDLQINESALDSTDNKENQPEQPPPPAKKKPRRRSKKRKMPKPDTITELANEIISEQLKNTTDITWPQRPIARFRPQDSLLNETPERLLTMPLTRGYAPALAKCYEDSIRLAKKRRLLPRSAPKLEEKDPSFASHSPDPGSPEPFMDDDDGFAAPDSESDGGLMTTNPTLDPPPVSLDTSSSSLLNPGSFGDVSGDVSSLLQGTPVIPTPETTTVDDFPQNSTVDEELAGDDDVGVEDSVAFSSETDDIGGWSSRTQKMLQYLSDNSGDGKESFVYQEMVQGKARKTAVGFVYELLVLKTHGLINLKQEKPYEKVEFSLTQQPNK